MHLCMASSIRAMPEKEKPLAMRVDLYCMWNRKQRVFGDIFLKIFSCRRRWETMLAMVIMRYTLRLLTLQRFERASMLIFSCELLKHRYHLGGTEITTGLCVGGKLTPNNLADARSSINKQQHGVSVGDVSNSF